MVTAFSILLESTNAETITMITVQEIFNYTLTLFDDEIYKPASLILTTVIKFIIVTEHVLQIDLNKIYALIPKYIEKHKLDQSSLLLFLETFLIHTHNKHQAEEAFHFMSEINSEMLNTKEKLAYYTFMYHIITTFYHSSSDLPDNFNEVLHLSYECIERFYNLHDKRALKWTIWFLNMVKSLNLESEFDIEDIIDEVQSILDKCENSRISTLCEEILKIVEE